MKEEQTLNDPKNIKDQAADGIEAPQKSKKKLFKLVTLLIFIAINAVILYFTAKNDFTGDKPAMTNHIVISEILPYLLGAILCVAVVLLAETFKYMLMMKRLGEKISFKNAFGTAALGKYFDCITPSGAGGQPFQIWDLHNKGYSAGASSAMPLAAFVTMQYGFVVLALVVITFNSGVVADIKGIRALAYIGVLAYAIVPTLIIVSAISEKASVRFVAFFIKIGAKLRIVKDPDAMIAKAESRIRKHSESMKYITKSKTLLGEMFLLSVVYHIALCSIPFFVIRMFGGDIGFITSLSMCVFVYASITIVPTPGNSGAAEGSFYILFSQLGESGIFWAMLVWRFLCYYSFIIIGLLVYGHRAAKKLIKKKAKESEQS